MPNRSEIHGLIEINLADREDWMALQRALVMMGGYGKHQYQCEAGVRDALRVHRNAQRSATKGYFKPGSSLYHDPAKTREWVRSRVAVLRNLKAEIEAEVERFAHRVEAQTRKAA